MRANLPREQFRGFFAPVFGKNRGLFHIRSHHSRKKGILTGAIA